VPRSSSDRPPSVPGLLKVGSSGETGLPEKDPTSPNAQELRIRDGADRQKSSWRSQRVSAPGAWLRRVSGIPVPLNGWKSPTISVSQSPQIPRQCGPRKRIETKATTVDEPTTIAGARLANKTIVDGGPVPPASETGSPKATFNMEDVDDALVRRAAISSIVRQSPQAVLTVAQHQPYMSGPISAQRGKDRAVMGSMPMPI